jgi:hypothetical protein
LKITVSNSLFVVISLPLLGLPLVLFEEDSFELLYRFLNVHSDRVLEAVNQVGLQVCHGSVVRDAEIGGGLRSQKLRDITPLLRLGVNVGNVVEESLLVWDQFVSHLLLDGCC